MMFTAEHPDPKTEENERRGIKYKNKRDRGSCFIEVQEIER